MWFTFCSAFFLGASPYTFQLLVFSAAWGCTIVPSVTFRPPTDGVHSLSVHCPALTCHRCSPSLPFPTYAPLPQRRLLPLCRLYPVRHIISSPSIVSSASSYCTSFVWALLQVLSPLCTITYRAALVCSFPSCVSGFSP